MEAIIDVRHLERIGSRDIRLGMPTRIDIFAGDGKLLLGCGCTISRVETVEHLQESGFKWVSDQCRSDSAKQPHGSVFLRIGEVADKLITFEHEMAIGPVIGVSCKFHALGKVVIECCDEDANAALAQSYLDYHRPYSVLHHLLTAIVVSVISKEMDWTEKDRVSLAAAALTHDLGALPMRVVLNNSERLDEAGQTLVHKHPDAGTELLSQWGVSDPLWLATVRGHHEALDGSGYPNGIHVDPLSGSALMSVADGVSVMMRPRPYRDRILGAGIIAELRRHAGSKYALAPIDAVAKFIGPYHAGCVLRLFNGDMAVVVSHHRPDQPTAPELQLIASNGDQAMDRPYPIDDSSPDNAIVSVLPPEMCQRFRNVVNKCWGA